MKLIAALALTLATPAAFFAAAPAYAADVKTLRCLEDNFDANGRALLMADLEKNLENSGKEQSYRPETVTAIQAAAMTCKAKHGWSTEAAQAAILYTMPKLGWPLALRMGRAKGVNGELLAKRVRALSDDERAQGLTDNVLGKLARGSLAAGEITSDNAALAGALYGLLLLQAKAYIDFAAA